jgi:hypothetical protein
MSSIDVRSDTAIEIAAGKVLFTVIEFSRAPIWEPYMVEDRNLVTGQNPSSAAVLGKRMLEMLAERTTTFAVA